MSGFNEGLWRSGPMRTVARMTVALLGESALPCSFGQNATAYINPRIGNVSKAAARKAPSPCNLLAMVVSRFRLGVLAAASVYSLLRAENTR